MIEKFGVIIYYILIYIGLEDGNQDVPFIFFAGKRQLPGF